ncbi:MAG TPA: ABC transporter permease [Bryobacteraceae bacterium]|jgi:putative ABC transport system permease protein|nr:ABC transporter permease [Bryobacteraceae bacterium]
MTYALRTLWRDRGFAVMAILSLAIGIGANAAIFSLVNGVLLRHLPYADAERLVDLAVSTPTFHNGEPLPINIAQLVGWRKSTQSFDGIAAYRNTTMSLTGDGLPELISGAVVSANFFEVLGVRPRYGRSFLEQEDHSGHHHVVMLADSVWRRRFSADPAVIGRTITLGGTPYTVVGILPPDFEFPKGPSDMGKRLTGRMEMFRPLGYQPDDTVPHGGDLNYSGIARLRAGVTIERARAEITAAEQAMDAQISGEAWHIVPLVTPLRQKLTGDVRQSLMVLLAAVGAVLLVLCVNLANLSLSRAAGRARESAIRTALGAGRWQLARQSIAETAILAVAGGGLGVLLAYLGLERLVASAPVDLPRLGEVSVDGRVLLFALAISALTALLFGILPAVHSASSAAPYETLKSTAYSNSGGPTGLRLRNLLVALEVGLCATLLVTAGLFLASFVRLTTIPRGFDIERVLAVDVVLPWTKYTDEAEISRFFETLLDKARAMPGVQSAAVSSYLPLEGESWIDIVSTENDTRPQTAHPSPNLRFISPGYFQTLHIPVREGRDFQSTDRNRMTAVISQSLARKLWPHDDPIGRKLMDHGKLHEVIGVVGDARSTSLAQNPVDMLYIPLWQRPQTSSSILVRTAMDPKSIASALRAAVWSADRDVPVPQERTLEQILTGSLERQRFQMTLVVLFAIAALALAAFGTYGVVSYAVARRRAEIGIRMALGAGQARVLRLVLRQGMTPVFAGLAGGAIAAWGIGAYVGTLLFQVSPHDPTAFAVSAGVLVAVSAVACWIPARRAAGVNPLEAIRYE